VNARQVVILPNNKNIIPVAEQVDAVTEKHVAVVPTRSIPEALAALVVYDPEADLGENVGQMGDAASSVVTGELTRAVRDSTSAAGDITEGDWVGLTRGEGIVATSPDVEVAATTLLEAIVGDGAELVTVIVGADADEDTTATIRGWLREHRGDVAAEVQHGGQPLYPYLFGVE
jgi:dihydroxyacetone kinase-like predicted kinase